MAIDPYSVCPGGLEKKVKFCCPDLVGELEKLGRLIEGEQHVACLAAVERLESQFKERTCLRMIKAQLLRVLNRVDEAGPIVQTLVREKKDNSIALAEAAILACNDQPSDVVVPFLHRSLAIDMESKAISPGQVHALVQVLNLLLEENKLVAARAHLYVYLSINKKDEYANQLLLQLGRSREIPLWTKELPRLPEAPADVGWRADYEAAMALARRAAWFVAAERLEQLAERVGEHPTILLALGYCYMFCGMDVAASATLSEYAIQDVPLDSAVFAETLAYCLAPTKPDRIEARSLDFPVLDIDRLVEVLLSDRRLLPVAVPTASPQDDQPPPRYGFQVLNRPRLQAGDPLTPATVPTMQGLVLIFGRQTDRPARLELTAFEGVPLETAQSLLQEIASALLGPAIESSARIVDERSNLELFLNPQRYIGGEHDIDTIMAFELEDRKQVYLEEFPKLPSRWFDNRTPQQAAQDPKLRIRVLAAIRVMETALDNLEFQPVFAALRERLQLPAASAIDPAQVDPISVHPMDLARVEFNKLSDTQLIEMLTRSYAISARIALVKVIDEALKRPTIADQLDRAELHGILAQVHGASRKALESIEQARQIDVARGRSAARWLISELPLRLHRGEGQEAQELLARLQRDHWREDGVPQAVYEILVRYGVITPQDASTTAAQRTPMQPAAASASGGLWTPDSAAPSEKKTLWVPGAE